MKHLSLNKYNQKSGSPSPNSNSRSRSRSPSPMNENEREIQSTDNPHNRHRNNHNQKINPEEGKLYLANIPASIPQKKIKEEFQKYGKILDHQFRKKTTIQNSYYYGYITFSRKSEAEQAMNNLTKEYNWTVQPFNKEGRERNNANNSSNTSYIIDSKMQDELINKFMVNDSSITNSIKRDKKIYHRHKSIENQNNKYIKGKQMNIIKKLLMSNNNSTTNNNSMRNSSKAINKCIYNNNFIRKRIASSNNSTINHSKNIINKTTKEINISHIIGNKNNIGCNFVNNINIFSNNLKQDNNNNIYIDNSVKKLSGNTSMREVINNNHLNSANNYINIHGNSNINYRNKQKDSKMVTSLSNSIPKNY